MTRDRTSDASQVRRRLSPVGPTVSAGRVRPGWPRKALRWRWPTLIRLQPNRWLRVSLTGAAATWLSGWMSPTCPRSNEPSPMQLSGLGGIDIVVNVAGGDTYHGTFEETTDEVWVRMIELNLLGVVRCCRAAIPHLRRSTRSPAIVNVSSINALAALGSEPYSSAKAGIGSLTINLAASLAADGIRVNTVAPATIRTRNWDRQEGGADRLRHLYPARTGRRTRGRRRRGRFPCFQRCGLDHRTHTPRRRWTPDRSRRRFKPFPRRAISIDRRT